MTKELTSEVAKKYGIAAGANIVGIAASKDFSLAPDGFKPTDVLPECLSVIVLGATFSPNVLDDIDEYTANRNTMLTTMTNIANEVAKQVKKEGYKTKVISATGGKWINNDGKKEQKGYISLKHAAEIAGLGVIGKNYLLTNPQYGNLLWFSAVLTDVELVPDKRTPFTMCNNCNKCIEACPVRALNNLASFGRKECSKFFTIEDKKLKIKCFLCRTICPHCLGNS
ncbi:MAG: epoxyqueuosine reductase [Nitrososphaerota archaeon]|jgi:epoxyqueuosine reductase QueG|uniref:epoxyqueuosine reductase n=1 Tax=Candidatus Bathycorpusculum sp. TaxID=2994959 RepID=UPI00281FD37C|nr:epoxyqueuosine reductase [Candidatus Termiticorpusculum sp.]MCL2256842.1 epoxyqueuosine reductase [Candidatus Termiticorpusculum sp.]MCL2293035.1 epoxyqueuosine reductase [Candidatus Termiticorpusculum sp.]MDR0459832.1 epoxyqueuosine reductase [Nitrososphaerota archaeon]